MFHATTKQMKHHINDVIYSSSLRPVCMQGPHLKYYTHKSLKQNKYVPCFGVLFEWTEY